MVTKVNEVGIVVFVLRIIISTCIYLIFLTDFNSKKKKKEQKYADISL